ncbi:MAG: complex I NDUFA9 subunit family protein [Acetobacteraceae bacterium]|nr:complex I NDUFA9 subunit family protein [Acetobacteraceae bacterium]
MVSTGATRQIATVFGGSGFLGRYIVKRFAQRGYIVRVAVRDTERALFLKPMGVVGQIVPLYARIEDDATVARAVQDADVVVSLVGVLAEHRAGDFDRIHAEGAGRVARLAAASGVSRLVHVSAIGADPASRSRYGASKARGEQAVRAAFPQATILRPSLVFGPEDAFFNRFGTMAQISPFMPVIAGATRMQPVYVGDVADAVLAATERTDALGKTYELGGPQVWTFREILAYILKVTRRRLRLVGIPHAFASLQAAILERLPGKMLTRDQLHMLDHDNVVSPGAPGLADLGVTPTPVDLVVPSYLKRFRPGGKRQDDDPQVPARAGTDLSR